MIKPLLFAASLLSGGGLLAYTVSLQQTERGLQRLEPSPASVEVIPPPRAVMISEPEPVSVEPAVLEIDPVVIQAPERRRTAPATVPARAETPAQACSGWRELGPQRVSSGAPSGTHQVRELCE